MRAASVLGHVARQPDARRVRTRSDRVTRELEPVLARSWPALETESIGSWTVRFAAGLTRRANSVLPRAPRRKRGQTAVCSWLEGVEEAYRRRGLPARFQVGPQSWPADLAVRLQARGYVETGRTLVLTAPLTELSCALEGSRSNGRRVSDEPTDEWLDTWSTAFGRDAKAAAVARAILHAIEPRCVFVAVSTGPVRAAVALGVVDGRWLSIQSLATLAHYRRRGCARTALATLADWGAVMGARDAYVAVEATNPARRLFDGLGFTERYSYSYFTLEDAEHP